jgi:hypothetical protein
LLFENKRKGNRKGAMGQKSGDNLKNSANLPIWQNIGGLAQKDNLLK